MFLIIDKPGVYLWYNWPYMENELVCFAYRFGYGATYNWNIKSVGTEKCMRLRSNNIFLEKSSLQLFEQMQVLQRFKIQTVFFFLKILLLKMILQSIHRESSVNPGATLIKYMKNMYGALRQNLVQSNETMPKDRVSFREVDKPDSLYTGSTGSFCPRLRSRNAPL